MMSKFPHSVAAQGAAQTPSLEAQGPNTNHPVDKAEVEWTFLV